MMTLRNRGTGRRGTIRCWPAGTGWQIRVKTGNAADGTSMAETHPNRSALEVRLADLVWRFSAAGFECSGDPFEPTPAAWPGSPRIRPS